MNVNKKIALYLKQNDVSQTELAKKLNSSQQNLNRLLKSNDIKISQLIEITKALELPVGYFFTEIKAENNNIEKYESVIETLHYYLLSALDAEFDLIRGLKSFIEKDSSLRDKLNEYWKNKNNEEFEAQIKLYNERKKIAIFEHLKHPNTTEKALHRFDDFDTFINYELKQLTTLKVFSNTITEDLKDKSKKGKKSNIKITSFGEAKD